MVLTDKDVEFCISEAHKITEQYLLYVLAPAHTMRSVDDLEWLIQTYCEKTVRVNELPIPADMMSVRGAFVAWQDGSYDVFLLSELNDRERRFVKCKELFHVLLDQPHCRSMDIYRQVEETQACFSLHDDEPNSPVAWEILAEIAAMEFLFPYAERVAVLARAADAPDFAAIAKRYGIPQGLVERYLSEPTMHEFGKVAA